jgi:O-methyltransferase
MKRIIRRLGGVKRALLGELPRNTTQDGIPLPTFHVVDASRFLFFKRMMDFASDVDGDVVECGVGHGRSLLFLALLCREEEKGRQLWGFDSFEGFPEPTAEDDSARKPKKGQYLAMIENVRRLFSDAQFDDIFMRTKVTLVKGFFDESLKKYNGQGIALLHLDADLYGSYKDCLNALYSQVNPGGVVVFDEYMDGITHVAFPGAKKAIDEFFLDKGVKIRKDKRYGKYYVVKPKPSGRR